MDSESLLAAVALGIPCIVLRWYVETRESRLTTMIVNYGGATMTARTRSNLLPGSVIFHTYIF